MNNLVARTGLSLLLVACGAAAAEAGEYRIVADESRLDILVFRAGALGRLGHNHVVSARGLTGRVRVGETAAQSSFELALQVANLVVDDPVARAEAGSAFAGEVSEDDRTGTRRNMLGEQLLDAQHWPEVRVRSTAVRGAFDDMTVTAAIHVKGEERTLELPVNVVFYNDRLIATGRSTVSHAALGLAPFTAGLGTLRVADDLTFRYRIEAVAAAEGEASGREDATAVVEDHGTALPDGTTE